MVIPKSGPGDEIDAPGIEIAAFRGEEKFAGCLFGNVCTKFKAVSGITIRRIRMTNIDLAVLCVAITITSENGVRPRRV